MKSSAKRILELNFERTWRGGERQTLYNMQGFQDAGVEVTLLCRKGYPLEERAVKAAFDVRSYNNVFGILFFLLTKAHKYDALHVQTSHLLTYAVLSKPFHRRPIVFTRRVDFVPKGAMTRMKYRLADKLVGISTAVKNIVEQFSGKPVTVISDVAEQKELNKAHAQQLIKEAQIPAGKHILGTTAALVPHKDPLNMVEAIHALSKERNDFVFLHFGSGELEVVVKNKIDEYGLQDVYKLMGFKEHVEDIFAVLDVFVMSSQEEGLGSSVLDAFLYNVPVVSTDAGGLIDLVRDGRGVICPRRDTQALANGIASLLDRPEMKDALCDRAYHYAIKYHSTNYITQQYLQLLGW